MVQQAFSRCNSGHYFSGCCCPLDGWSCRASQELDAACRKLQAADLPLSLAALQEAGVSRQSLPRIIIIEFGSPDAVFEALSPQGHVLHGKWHPIEDLEDAFL